MPQRTARRPTPPSAAAARYVPGSLPRSFAPEVAIDDVHYVITFRSPDDGSTTVLRAGKVGDSDLGPGFICLSQLLFDTESRLANPVEEGLKARYQHTRRLHLHVFSIQSIAEVGADHPGLKLDTDRSNLVVFPAPRPTGKGPD